MGHFEKAAEFVFAIEQGYVNDPDDRGGETKYGISKRAHPDLDIENLTKAQAKQIYLKKYWLGAHCDKMPRHYAWALFDAAIHHGPKRAIKFLQQALRVKADGVFGPATHSVAWLDPEVRYQQVLHRMHAIRAAYMHRIAAKDKTQERFINGWFLRVFKLHTFILRQR